MTYRRSGLDPTLEVYSCMSSTPRLKFLEMRPQQLTERLGLAKHYKPRLDFSGSLLAWISIILRIRTRVRPVLARPASWL